MTDFLDSDGIFYSGISVPPILSQGDFDLGEILPSNFVLGQFWGKSGNIISPVETSDKVAIGAHVTLYDETLFVHGKTLADGGFMLSNTVYITKDVNNNNMIFTDPVAGSVSLYSLLSGGNGDVTVSGTPTTNQLAYWTGASSIGGLNVSSLTINQSQVTNLTLDLAGKASTIHNLIDTVNHPVSGLTTGYFLKALSATTYGFDVHGLTNTDIGLGNVTNDAQVKKAASSTDNALVLWDGITGDKIKDSNASYGEAGINIPTGTTYNINGTPHTHSGVYQIYDATLDALALLDTTVGFIYQTGTDIFTKYNFAGSGSANSVSRSDHNHSGVYLTANQNIVISGDISGSGTTAITATLPAVNSTPIAVSAPVRLIINTKGLITEAIALAAGDLHGIYGSQTVNYVYAAPSSGGGSPSFRLLVASDIPNLAQSQITGLVSDLSGKQPLDTTLTSISALADSAGYLYNNGSGGLYWSTPAGTGNVSNSGTPATGQLARWVTATSIEGIAQATLATDAFGSLTDITTNNSTTSAHGFLPKLAGNTTTFLRGDGTWAAPSGSGNVSTSGTIVTGTLPIWDGSTTIASFGFGAGSQLLRMNSGATAIEWWTPTYLTANQTITLSGAVTGSGTTAITTTLATVNANVGSFGSATQVPVFTVNAKGLITAASNTTIQIAESQVTNLVTDLAGRVIANGAITAGTKLKITYDTKGLVTAGADATLASADFVNQGTTTTVLHGNAAGNPSWGAIVGNDITNATIVYAKIQNVSATNRLLGRVSASAGVMEEITVGGDFTQSGSTFTIGSGVVTEGKIGLSDVTTKNATSSMHGYLPKLSGTTSTFFRGDGTWVAPTNYWARSSTILSPYTSTDSILLYSTLSFITDATISASNGTVSSINGKHLYINAGNGYDSDNSIGGDVKIFAGSTVNDTDDTTISGALYLSSGYNAYEEYTKPIYLGDTTTGGSDRTLQVIGSMSGIDLNLYSKGIGVIRIGNTLEYDQSHVYISGLECQYLNGYQHITRNRDNIEAIGIDGGVATSTNIAGDIRIFGGSGYGANPNGGNVHIFSGNAASGGVEGDIYFGYFTTVLNGGLKSKTTETNVVYYDPTTGKLSYGSVSAGSTPVDSTLLDWSTDKYQPYTAAAAGAFDNSSTTPTGTTRLNYGGYFYSTKLFAGANELIYHTTDSYVRSTNLTMTTAGTWYNACTLSLAAGTWLIVANIVAGASSSAQMSMTGRLYNDTGATQLSASEFCYQPGDTPAQVIPIALSTIVTLSVTSTIYAQMQSNQSGPTIYHTSPIGGVGGVTYMKVVKIAA